ncbi:site-specific recombinase XerD [Hoeflea sp. IMCC20628]|uniref:site-specific integrase n=1 Tax=Hoeflea sp. IMCC20628 TaxID=1620421 RepID=UPI00063AAAD5|nr:site-specific integrase [Hoeflea sp. IMCC20628]AKI01424.1 site-specific recombinase XerD [Hoeflea sp. IMCC20628]
MARLSYLLRRNGSYYARMRVPIELVDAIGKKELVKALGTKDENEAKRLMWRVVEGWNREFDELRSRRDITPDDQAVAVWQRYEEITEQYDQKSRTLPTSAEIEVEESRVMRRLEKGEIRSDLISTVNAYADYEMMLSARTDDANVRARRLAALRRALNGGDFKLVESTAQKFVSNNRLLIDSGSEQYRELCSKLMRSEIEGLQRTLERDDGDYSGIPKDPIVKPATGKARETAEPGEETMELFETYASENPRNITADTINQARRDIGSFVDYVGNTCPAHRIDKKAVREWKALLMKYPVKATETKAFAGMRLVQIIKHNETVGKPVLTPRTVNRYLSSLGAFCNWLAAHGYLDQSPTIGMSLAKVKKKSTLPFTTEQLNTLFKSPLFAGCQSAAAWSTIAKPGNEKIRDHRFWVPLIMLYSGARPAEIAQLSIDDIREQHGHWIMHITTEGGGDKSVKTDGSMRVVPVHKELIKLGLLNYQAGMKSAGQARLFPQAERNSRGQMIADFSREFGRYLTRIGIKNGRGLSLYSFRHGAADALRRAGHLDEQFGFILGHTSGTMTGRYGNLPEGMLEQRVALIDSIAYPGLELDHLNSI